MIQRILAAAAMLLIVAALSPHSSAHGGQEPDGSELISIVDALKDRYAGKNFSADFHQESTLSALDISDTAGGKAWFNHPGRMRWEYRFPDRHVIVTDGETLWIHRPEENQVVKGDAAKYFGGGKGAGFLSNFGLITEAFDIGMASDTESHWRLELVPRERHYELSAIYLKVNKETTEIEQVVTENAYGDTTTIAFENLRFSSDMDSSLFEFEIPKGADIIYMEE
ncbi:MAG: outer membrane lipoprotein carrier protein LolA [Desulfosalsimonadaceae bacterium]